MSEGRKWERRYRGPGERLADRKKPHLNTGEITALGAQPKGREGSGK